MKAVKILYTGPLGAGQSCLARMEALRDLGHDVIPVDVSSYFDPLPRIIRAVERRAFVGPGTARYNAALVAAARRTDPHVVWVDKGVFVYARTLATLNTIGSAILVHYNTDDVMCSKHPFFLLRKAIPLYDIQLTTNGCNVDDLKRLGARRVVRTALRYDHRLFNGRHYSSLELEPFRSDVLFVGHWEEETEARILAMIDAGIHVRVWGENWHKARHKTRLRGFVTPRALWLDDYLRALSATKIALCFLSRWNRNTAAMRSFEIPAASAFLLAERTDEHLAAYQEGFEAEFFGDTHELLRKIGFYLANDDKRRAIAARGQERCLRSGYSYREQMKRDWTHVEELLAISPRSLERVG